MRLLFVAADPMEFRGIVSHAREISRMDLPVSWVRAGKLGDYEILLAANGTGWRRAAAAVDAAATSFPPEAVVSAGFCGALDPSLRISELVVATSVAGPSDSWCASIPVSTAPFRTGIVRSIDRVATTPEEKAKLRAAGGCAVEMEAAGVAERTTRLNVPFFCIRTVTDLATERMANDFDAALRPDGHLDTMIILRAALRRPAARLPELVRLRRRAVLAARTLGDFIASCRF